MRSLLALILGAASIAAQSPAAPTTATAGSGEAWRLVQPPQSSLVYARDGSLIGEIGKEWRTSVPLASLPRYVSQAFVAVEDQRFYQHDGVDVVGMAGALKDALLGDPRGASTITQQLVGNMHPDLIDRREKSISRKLREQAAAREMEKHYTKAQILEAYLNQINFGHGWYGIEAAARHYFGKNASRLTLDEAASLAALPKGPALYEPAKYPDRNLKRRNSILDQMVAQKLITEEQATAAKARPVKALSNGGMSAYAPYYLDVVRQLCERAGVRVSDGGYRIWTALDPALQRATQVAVVEGTAATESRPGFRHPTFSNHAKGSTDYLQGAAVAIDATTGDVKALVGGRNYAESPFNRITNGLRQPGSSFKPFVYAAAIADSIAPNAIVPDTSLEIQYDRVFYRPKNADGEYLGNLTLREALTRSRNPVAVQLWEKVGADSMIAFAHRMGIRSTIAPYPSSAIGASVVQPLDLVAAYTAFPNLGTPVEPRFVYRVEDRAGRRVFGQAVTALPPAMSPEVAFIVRDMMRDVVERGTGTVARRWLPATTPLAGKTGTTDDNTDTWFVGCTADLCAGVWLGFDRPKPIMGGVAGGVLAAPIFGQMIARGGAARPGEWTPPPGLVTAELDRDSGQLATAITAPDKRYREYFLPGTEPGALRIDARRLFRLGPIVF
ncbi:MAG: PBP1A family penicillin-binding protein [Gemmatimonadaceae bacterium]|nr:PBP1A family penicillin-binding protein [Gemmatimonadaceae bacterium]